MSKKKKKKIKFTEEERELLFVSRIESLEAKKRKKLKAAGLELLKILKWILLVFVIFLTFYFILFNGRVRTVEGEIESVGYGEWISFPGGRYSHDTAYAAYITIKNSKNSYHIVVDSEDEYNSIASQLSNGEVIKISYFYMVPFHARIIDIEGKHVQEITGGLKGLKEMRLGLSAVFTVIPAMFFVPSFFSSIFEIDLYLTEYRTINKVQKEVEQKHESDE